MSPIEAQYWCYRTSRVAKHMSATIQAKERHTQLHIAVSPSTPPHQFTSKNGKRSSTSQIEAKRRRNCLNHIIARAAPFTSPIHAPWPCLYSSRVSAQTTLLQAVSRAIHGTSKPYNSSSVGTAYCWVAQKSQPVRYFVLQAVQLNSS